MIKDNILDIQKRIEQYQNTQDAPHLLAVSKKHSSDAIKCAYDAGLRKFGENYVQEAVDKIVELEHLDIEWHFIGHIQSKKCSVIAQHFQWIQTVDRIKVAEKLNQAANAPLQILIQINIDEDPNKGGISADDTLSFASQLSAFTQLNLRGLMCMPSVKTSAEANRESFKRMRLLFEELQQAGYAIDTLSMGMSGDYPIAIEEGSSMIRLGTQIFGSRPAT